MSVKNYITEAIAPALAVNYSTTITVENKHFLAEIDIQANPTNVYKDESTNYYECDYIYNVNRNISHITLSDGTELCEGDMIEIIENAANLAQIKLYI